MSKRKDKCIFNDKWLRDNRYSSWLHKANKWRAYCKFCSKDFDISNMGISALDSHASGKKHSEIAKIRIAGTGNLFFAKHSERASSSSIASISSSSAGSSSSTVTSSSSSEASTTLSAASSSSTVTKNITDFILPANTFQAEILWALKVVVNHFSMWSCLGLNDLFRRMFPDSNVAKSFQLSKTKCGYLINYGLAPYFRELLNKLVMSSPFFTISYDESMNKVLQKEQMDLQVRFWDDTLKQVRTRYLSSTFLQRPNAKNLLDCLLEELKKFSPSKLLQLSMDGPNVNWNVFELLKEERSKQEYPQLVNIGSCGLHIVHGAFKTAIQSSEWNISKILKSMWQLFHDSPARREIYIRVCESDDFPLRYV